MHAKSKKILITTETHELFILRKNRREAIHEFCPKCESKVELMSIDTAVSFAQKGTRQLFELIESGSAHSIETTTGHLLICKNSLAGKEAKAEKL